eukprot:scaffold13134_cov69-Phaeocystis_antarctica.AAC.16
MAQAGMAQASMAQAGMAQAGVAQAGMAPWRIRLQRRIGGQHRGIAAGLKRSETMFEKRLRPKCSEPGDREKSVRRVELTYGCSAGGVKKRVPCAQVEDFQADPPQIAARGRTIVAFWVGTPRPTDPLFSPRGGDR